MIYSHKDEYEETHDAGYLLIVPKFFPLAVSSGRP